MSTISVTSSYSGDALKKYILGAIIGGETLSTTGIDVHTNIKLKRTLKKLAATGVVKAHSCSFSPTSGVTITEASLEPKKFKINESICFDDVYEMWDSADMAAGVNNETLPQSLVDGLTEAYVGQAAKEIEEAIWQGNSTGNTGTIKDLFDGYEKILGAKDVTGTTLTVSNVATELNKVIAAQNAGVMKKSPAEKVIFMSHKGASLYQMNLQTQGIMTTAEEGKLSLYGIEIKPIGGFSNDNMIALGARNNFSVGTDLQSDFNEVKLLDQRENDGSDKVNFVMKGKIDVAIAYPNEIVWYKL